MQVLILALEAAIYPTLIAAVVILLAQPKRTKLLGVYLGGGLTISIGVGLALVFAAEPELEKQGSSSTLSWTTDLAIGGLALLVAVAIATRADERLRRRREARKARRAKGKPAPHPDPAGEADDKEPWSQRLLAGGSAPIVFLAALFLNLPGAAYLVGLKDIAAGGHSTGTDILLVLVFNAIMFAFAEIPMVGLLVRPEPTEALVLRVNAWFSRNSRGVAMAVLLFFGVYLVIRGISDS